MVRPPTIAIAICTFNRAPLLRLLLEDVVREHDGGALDVLIVDNNSADDTASVVDSFADRLPVRRVVEPRQGIAFARNRAMRDAHGDVIVFVDDDVRLQQGWLAAYRRAFADATIDAAGGRIKAVWPARVPRWARGSDMPPFATMVPAVELGDMPRVIDDVYHAPVTANIGVRATVLRELGGFREDLGHGGGRTIYGEDVEFLQRLLRTGKRVMYFPDAAVDHPIDPRRLSLRLNLRDLYRGGIAQARYDGPAVGTPSLLGVPRWVLRRIASSAARAAGCALTARSRAAAVAAGQVAVMMGYARGCRDARSAT